ncbi:MAG TPA: sugar ABC transporter substrate-binding protein [Streptosporangiaceae bacterium]|nr:sugar ABC transporter substrate-binding protein [Streptosporangiaceae bacterium]
MRITRVSAAAAAAATACALVAACGGGSSTGGTGGGSGSTKNATITYWASNQGASLQADYNTLNPELKKFKQQTGITVKLQVIGWADLLNRILAATTSGQGPDVVNIGNTWSASLQATGAFLPMTTSTLSQIGGSAKFLTSAMGSTGAAGQTPIAVPIYSLAYGLYYNKAEFKAAGISTPPATWDQVVADGKKLTKGGNYGLAIEGANPSENIHNVFILSKQKGGSFFDSSGNPTFTTAANVAAVQQWVNFMATDKIVNPGDAEYDQNQSVADFAKGKAAMLLWQAAGTTLKADGMSPDAWGVAAPPVESGTPSASNPDSMVAGINIAVFKASKNQAAALKFVKFMTSQSESTLLNGKYGSITPVKAALSATPAATQEQTVLRNVLSNSATPLPQVAKEAQFETAVGGAVKTLFADAAAGKPVSAATVKQQLSSAQQQMNG